MKQDTGRCSAACRPVTKEITAVNTHGAKALQHWRTYLPGQLAQIPDPQDFFTQLGETAETRIDQLAETLAAAQPAQEDEGYLQQLARLQTARTTAEAQVTREMILIDPEDQENIAQLLG